MALRCFSTGDPLCFGFELGQSEITLKPEYLRLQPGIAGVSPAG